MFSFRCEFMTARVIVQLWFVGDILTILKHNFYTLLGFIHGEIFNRSVVGVLDLLLVG